MCAGVGSRGRLRKVLEGPGVGWCRFRRQVPKVLDSSGVCWCRFWRQVPEGSGGFRCVLVWVLEAGSKRFRRVPVCAGVVPEGCGGFRCVLV